MFVAICGGFVCFDDEKNASHAEYGAMWVFVMFHSKQNTQAKVDVTMVVVTELSQIYNFITTNLLINQNYKI